MGSRVLLALLAAASVHAAEPVSFNRDIRPIMADTCFKCHGPDRAKRQAGMRLDIREEALKPTRSGVTPIVPGDPERSAIIQRVFATKPEEVMPPESAHKPLRARQKQLLRQWVAEGAKYEGHWAFQPIVQPLVPPGAQHPVDAFIRQRLAREGLRPSPEAVRRTLLRRVSLDLTGLPPSPEEVAAFMADRSPDAYEKLVDRLLASPRYAEKQALHWLDAVRYADTAGFHGDKPYPVWPYRDYVLRAFRDNKPFDQFTREQIAGDLLPNATVEQKVAAAYNRLNRVSAEGGLQPKEYLAKYGADRVRTLSAAWLGATVGCAECHDHKFDPFLSRDFYAMKAFFADIKETGLVPDRGANAWGSLLPLPTPEQERRLAELKAETAQARTRLDAKTAAFAAQIAAWEERLRDPQVADRLTWRVQKPVAASSLRGAKLAIHEQELLDFQHYVGGNLITERKPANHLIIAQGPNPDNETYIVKLRPGPGEWTALGVEVVQDDSLPASRFARGADRLALSEVEAELDGRPLRFVLAAAGPGAAAPEHPAMAAIDGDPLTAWGVTHPDDVRSLFLAVRFAGQVTTRADSELVVRLRHDSEYRKAAIGWFRLWLSAGQHAAPDAGERRRARTPPNPPVYSGLPDEVQAALALKPAERRANHLEAMKNYFVYSSPECEALLAALWRAEAAQAMFEASLARVLLTEAVIPGPTRILPRGNFLDESGAVVEPAIPVFLGKLETNGRRASRLDLANWLVAPSNPLTARVFVNRTWRQFFGTGLSKTLDDLGSQGEWPSHPELLDWLAAEFRRDWDVRRLIRTIVTSQTYRQSSRRVPAAEARDPENRLLARQNRFRVDAEVVHDIALAVSGLLVERFGGPSVRPYQPEGYLFALNFPRRDYSASRGSDLYRRRLYVHWQRAFLHPSLMTFDAPSREECTVNRAASNTPLQALVMLNDPIFVEAARVFAQNSLHTGGFHARLNWAFARALSRAPTPQERRILSGLYATSLARFRASPENARRFLSAGDAPLPPGGATPQLAAMTTVTRAILNLHETITRD